MARKHLPPIDNRQKPHIASPYGVVLSMISVAAATLQFVGCSASRPAEISHSPSIERHVTVAQHATRRRPTPTRARKDMVAPVSYQASVQAAPRPMESLAELEAQAERLNPTLRRLSQESEAAQAKVDYVGRLPDPSLRVNAFGHPIETAAGSQRANIAIMQMLPSLSRLDAKVQKACLEALARRQIHKAARLSVIGDIRATWYRLYVLAKQMETTVANQRQLKSLIDRANSTVATGKGSPTDVRLGTVEYSRLQERVLTLRQQRLSATAELNRIVGRDAGIAVAGPVSLAAALPDWTPEMLRQLAYENHPALAAAEIRAQATRWGVEIARLQRRPDITVGASWFAIAGNRPASGLVDVGRDAWSVGAQLSIPLSFDKYDAMEREAAWNHAASHASVDEQRQRIAALLRDLWEKARSAKETASLYQATILPEAKRTLNADLAAYINGTIEFDRVIRDFRTVLTLELGYHQAIGDLATALARIRQATAVELVPDSPPMAPLPLPGRESAPE